MGQSDIHLSNVGTWEAEQAVHALGNYRIDAIVSSPLKRCLVTVSPSRAARDCGLIVDSGWAERSWGIYEGRPKRERGKEASPPGGETDDEFTNRVNRALNELSTQGTVLLVSHSGVFREICKLG